MRRACKKKYAMIEKLSDYSLIGEYCQKRTVKPEMFIGVNICEQTIQANLQHEILNKIQLSDKP